jgi:hypothetical protein
MIHRQPKQFLTSRLKVLKTHAVCHVVVHCPTFQRVPMRIKLFEFLRKKLLAALITSVLDSVTGNDPTPNASRRDF